MRCLFLHSLRVLVLPGIVAAFLSVASVLQPAKASAIERPYPYLQDRRDQGLQHGLNQVAKRLKLERAISEKRFGAALVDITDLNAPKFAGINAEVMMYAASLPKVGILLGLFRKVQEDQLALDYRTATLAKAMVQDSSNRAASELFYMVGPAYLESLFTSPQYRLYDVSAGGGLWVGKEYGQGEAWKRDPILHLSHAASALKVAQLYYMLESGQLLSPGFTQAMKSILGETSLEHKFYRGLMRNCPSAKVFRKSGSWRQFHSDSAIVEHDGKRYIAVALTNDANGSRLLEDLIVEMDTLIVAG
ncbi:MAG: serine hydrolase [Deltaproteobacteria bacterium]|nr:serine hydrolase [Deltaproteobacteria bacterium]